MKYPIFIASCLLQTLCATSAFAANLECTVTESSPAPQGAFQNYKLDSDPFVDQGRGGISGSIKAISKIDPTLTFNMNGLYAANQFYLALGISEQSGLGVTAANNSIIEPNIHSNVVVARANINGVMIEIDCHIVGLPQAGSDTQTDKTQ